MKEALKLALEALKHLQPTALTSFYTIGNRDKAITTLRQAIKQAEQAQPVAYIRLSKTGNVMACAKTEDFYKLPDKTLLYTSPPQGIPQAIPQIPQEHSSNEPAEYQVRTRPNWNGAPGWSDWTRCSKEAAGDYAKTPTFNDWDYEVRGLYTAPPPRQTLTLEQKRGLIKNSDLWDMHVHIGWYSVPAKSFAEKAMQFIADIEAAHNIGVNT